VARAFHANKSQDFAPFGIISTDDETIKSVDSFVAGGCKEVKQIEFSYCLHTDPRPVAASPKPMLTAGTANVTATGCALRLSVGAHMRPVVLPSSR
jgi:hypothetical protein